MDPQTEQSARNKSTFNEWRSETPSKSVYSSNIRISQQTCQVKNNRTVITAWHHCTNDLKLKKRLNGLLARLETLLLPSTFDLKKDIDSEFETIFKHGGFLSFDEAFEI